jgi:5'-nucleotidase
MIDIMNRLDGNEYGFDDRMFVIFGNHEFDDSKCGSLSAVLDDRVNQSQFAWLNSNLDFSSCGMLDSIAAQQKVKEDVLLNVGPIKIGLFGIGLTPEGAEGITPKDYPNYQSNRAVAAKRIDSLRASGADFIIAVTHLYWGDDQKLLDEFGSKGLNLIIGGHDHECMTLTARDGSAFGFKADSDAKTAWRIDLDFPASGKPLITRRIFKLDDAIEPDPGVARRSEQWQSKAETEICKKMAKEEKMLNDPACLDQEIGSTQADLELEESDNRTRETAFGDWLADEVRKKAKADVALINSGTLGLDETVAAGSKLKLRRLKEIFRYDDNIATWSVPVGTVCEALKHGFGTPGKGAWPHVSGVNVELQDAESGKKSAKVLSFTDRPDIDCASTDKIKVAALPYLLCDGDAYNFGILKDMPDTETCISRLSASGEDNGRLITIAKTAIALAGNAGIEPKTRGHISPPSAAQPTPRPPICDSGNSETSQYR